MGFGALITGQNCLYRFVGGWWIALTDVIPITKHLWIPFAAKRALVGDLCADARRWTVERWHERIERLKAVQMFDPHWWKLRNLVPTQCPPNRPRTFSLFLSTFSSFPLSLCLFNPGRNPFIFLPVQNLQIAANACITYAVSTDYTCREQHGIAENTCDATTLSTFSDLSLSPIPDLRFFIAHKIKFLKTSVEN